MNTPNVEPTAEAIDLMAQWAAKCAEELHMIASRMRVNSDLSLAAEAVNCVSNLYPNLRLDLLIIRPLRSLGAA